MKKKNQEAFIMGLVAGAAVAFLLSKQSSPQPPVRQTDVPNTPRTGMKVIRQGQQRIGIRPWATAWSAALPLHV